MISAESAVTPLSADQLRRFFSGHAESEYLVVDVRQPEEYARQHLPGAQLVPLMEIEGGGAPLPPSEHGIFYCYSGQRSRRAAEHVAGFGVMHRVYTLDGGLLAWNGVTVPEFPNLQVFDGSGSLEQVLRRAMDLEKGAGRLYEWLCDHIEDARLRTMLTDLARSERVHARALYDMLGLCAEPPSTPFDPLYDRLAGDVLESGEPLSRALARLAPLEHEPAALLELALHMEFKALDLYRNLGELVAGGELREMLLELAEHEKRHAHSLISGLSYLSAP